MTDFKDLELIYNQLGSLSDEIDELINDEDYSLAKNKVAYRDKLFKRAMIAKRTVNLTRENEAYLEQLESKIIAGQKKNIDKLTELRDKIKIEIQKTKKRVKLNSMYSFTPPADQGNLIDFSE